MMVMARGLMYSAGNCGIPNHRSIVLRGSHYYDVPKTLSRMKTTQKSETLTLENPPPPPHPGLTSFIGFTSLAPLPHIGDESPSRRNVSLIIDPSKIYPLNHDARTTDRHGIHHAQRLQETTWDPGSLADLFKWRSGFGQGWSGLAFSVFDMDFRESFLQVCGVEKGALDSSRWSLRFPLGSCSEILPAGARGNDEAPHHDPEQVADRELQPRSDEKTRRPSRRSRWFLSSLYAFLVAFSFCLNQILRTLFIPCSLFSFSPEQDTDDTNRQRRIYGG